MIYSSCCWHTKNTWDFSVWQMLEFRLSWSPGVLDSHSLHPAMPDTDSGNKWNLLCWWRGFSVHNCPPGIRAPERQKHWGGDKRGANCRKPCHVVQWGGPGLLRRGCRLVSTTAAGATSCSHGKELLSGGSTQTMSRQGGASCGMVPGSLASHPLSQITDDKIFITEHCFKICTWYSYTLSNKKTGDFPEITSILVPFSTVVQNW